MKTTDSKKNLIVADFKLFKEWFTKSYHLLNKEIRERALEIPSLGCAKYSERKIARNFGPGVPLSVRYNTFLT